MGKGSGGGSKGGSSGSSGPKGGGPTKASTDNRANQLNPNNPTYSSSRAHN